MTAKEHAVGSYRSSDRTIDGTLVRTSERTNDGANDEVSDRPSDSGPGFDIALWGYDRRQVDRCLDDLTGRLEEALSQVELVEALEVQLYQAQLEIERLRHQPVVQPAWSDRLANIMAAAEYLWSQAAREADAARNGSAVPYRSGASNGAVAARSGLR